MKRPPARPLCSVLLLTLLAVAITCRTVLRCGGSGSFELKSAAFLAGRPAALTPVSFDSSMLKYAEIDIAEEKFKKDIEQLLDGNFEGHGRHRTFSEWRTFSLRDPEARTSRSSTSTSLRSPQFYRYWLDFRRNLQHWARNKRFEPEVMNDLIRLVKHPLDKHRGLAPSDRRYASCAVVGNSGILLRGNHGTLIDRHEVVIRLNNARIEGFERDVGTKTTLSFINSNILHFCSRRDKCYCHPYGTDTPIAMYICQPVHFLDYTMCNSSHRSPLLVTDPRFDILCGRIVKYYSLKRFVTETGKALDAWDAPHDAANFHYSSGMQGVMLALGICDRVSMFGFGKSASAKHHYHTNQRAELSLHDYEAEYDLYRDLVERPQAIPFISDKFNFPPLVIYQ